MNDDVTRLPDLASRALAGSVVCATDELFAPRENLIKPGPAGFSPDEFGPKGKVYDGWETRRRRDSGHDFAIVRLGAPGVVRGIVIDTSWFTGNYPPFASVEATGVEGYPSPDELGAADWVTLIPKSPLKGDTTNAFAVDDERRFTHIRLSIYPDGGVARLRVHGDPLPDPRLLTGTIDLAALEHGASVVACSNEFYSSPAQMLLPDRPRVMSDGWENARRRDDGNDFVTVRLGARGFVKRVEIDTSCFVGNAPGWARLRGVDASGAPPPGDAGWREVVPKTRLQPDTRHFFAVRAADPVTHLRLDVYPDGGIARLRVHGEVAGESLQQMAVSFLDRLPEGQARGLLSRAGCSAADVARLLARRPFGEVAAIPEDVLASLIH